MCAGAWRGQPQLLLSKALRLLNGVQQLLLQLFIALVRWEIQTVETVERGVETVSTGSSGLLAEEGQERSGDCGSTTTPASWRDAEAGVSRTLLLGP